MNYYNGKSNPIGLYNPWARHTKIPLHWRQNDYDAVSNHQPHDCLLNRVFKRRSKKTSKLRVTGLCAGNSPGPVNSPHKGASNAENVSIWWRHHDTAQCFTCADNLVHERMSQVCQWTEDERPFMFDCDIITDERYRFCTTIMRAALHLNL